MACSSCGGGRVFAPSPRAARPAPRSSSSPPPPSPGYAQAANPNPINTSKPSVPIVPRRRTQV